MLLTLLTCFNGNHLLCRLIKEEGHNLEEAIIKCKDMTETLLSLRKCVHTLDMILVVDYYVHRLASSDSNRSLLVPTIHAVTVSL